MTTWKRIPHLEARFEASTCGQIQTLPYSKDFFRKDGKPYTRNFAGRILLQRNIDRNQGATGPQPYVTIYRGNSREDYVSRETRVAYLVAATFLGLPYDKSDQSDVQRWRLRFKDGNAFNCAVSNLEWVHSIGGAEGGQEAYGRHKDGWEARKADLSGTMGRLFAA